MTIDNIQLSEFLCRNLFTNNLIGIKQEDKMLELLNKPKFQFLGLNNQHILFLVNSADDKYLAEAEMEFLINLLTACKLSVEDIALVNFAHFPDITLSALINDLKCQKILTFGISPKDLKLPFNVPEFQIQKFQNQVYLFNPNLNQILKNVVLKKNLWNCLKTLFAI